MAKIAYIGKFRKLYDEEQIARGFENLGHTVIRKEESECNQIDLPRELKCLRPDIILFAKMRIPGNTEDVMSEFKKFGLKTASWTFDIYWDSPRQTLMRVLPHFQADYVFTTDGGNDADFKKAGINHQVVRQGICEEYAYLGKPNDKYKCDVVFVGCENPWWTYRNKVMDFLKDRYGERFHWFGRENTNEIRGHDLNELCASAKIIIGDSVYSPHYWSNRIYETIGRGGFFIHPVVEGLNQEFEPYKEFIPYNFNDFGGLAQKIDYYLTHDKERDEIRIRGFERCVNDYHYTKRCAEVSKVLFG